MDKQTTQFEDDLVEQDGWVVKGMWNLICTKRDLTMYCKHGWKPHRRWKVTDVKKYFGITGTGEKLLSNFMEIFDKYAAEYGLPTVQDDGTIITRQEQANEIQAN